MITVNKIISPINLLLVLLVIVAFLLGIFWPKAMQESSESTAVQWQASEILPETDHQQSMKQLNPKRWQVSADKVQVSSQSQKRASYQLLAVIQQGGQTIALLRQSTQQSSNSSKKQAEGEIFRVREGDTLEPDIRVLEINKTEVLLQKQSEQGPETFILTLYKAVDS